MNSQSSVRVQPPLNVLAHAVAKPPLYLALWAGILLRKASFRTFRLGADLESWADARLLPLMGYRFNVVRIGAIALLVLFWAMLAVRLRGGH